MSASQQKRPTPGRPTREASEELIRHVLTIAEKEFLGRGFEGASIEGIAQAAGTSKLTLYRHFEHKKGLFIAVVQQLVVGYALQLSGRIDTSRAPREVLSEIGGFLANCYFTPQGQGLTRIMIGELPRIEGLADISNRMAVLARGPVETYLTLLQSRRQAVFDNVQRAAAQFVNLCMLGQYYLLCDAAKSIPSPEERAEIVASAVRVFAAAYLVADGAQESTPRG